MSAAADKESRAMVEGAPGEQEGAPPNVELWSRDGFVGAMALLVRPHYTPDYRAFTGPHAPHQLDLRRVDAADRRDPAELSTPVLVARDGSRLSVSARQAPMPFVVRNVEADEMHFVQEGEIELTTDYGVVTAGPGDFVCIPRGVAYTARPLSPATLSVLLEIPEAVRIDTPAPFGMINVALDLHRPTPAPPAGASGETVLLLKCLDGVTRFVVPHDPLASVALISGPVPVWKVKLRKIAPSTYEPSGGPPVHFAASASNGALIYTVSSRRSGRPPIHVNADYDEIILFHAGPGVYGGLNEPGLLSWVPKGIAHHGPSEQVAEGYQAWLLESRSTFRLTQAGAAAAMPMETSSYGVHPSR